MKIDESTRKHLTAEEYQWAESNVANYKLLQIAGDDVCMLTLKNGNIVLGYTIEEAVRMERGQTGEVIELDGFETDELHSLLWDE